jgi:hypothetical protein
MPCQEQFDSGEAAARGSPHRRNSYQGETQNYDIIRNVGNEVMVC